MSGKHQKEPGHQARDTASPVDNVRSPGVPPPRARLILLRPPGQATGLRSRCYPGCRCRADPPQLHGPYHQWTRKKNGKTATRILSDEQLADYGPWFDNHRRLRELITELEQLSLGIAEADPGWNR